MAFHTMFRATLRSHKLGLPLKKVARTEKAQKLIRSFSSQKGTGQIFRQYFDQDSWTYTYLIADRETKRAILVDPVIDQVKRDELSIKRLGLDLIYCVNTHVHADHITGSGLLKEEFRNCRSVIGLSGNENAVADIKVEDNTTLSVDSIEFQIRHTPGHTKGCITLVNHEYKYALTGDTLLIQGCGRTDFQGGSSEALYDSIQSSILALPDDYELWPAHDYNGRSVSTVLEEKEFNTRARLSKREFIDFMAKLNLPYPRKIDESLPANLKCGLYDLPERFQWYMNQKEQEQTDGAIIDHVVQVEPSVQLVNDVRQNKYYVLDVRDPDELVAGTQDSLLLPGYHNIPLADLGRDNYPAISKGEPILLVCRSGIRSQQAGKVLSMLGFTQLYNLAGGAIKWGRQVYD
eukprot:CAMPEP_0204864286 /NCGR_PEP_ID=MMETSP1348-20121228/3954_1 /ASSEMBLY_ACC=CAM_ASM_000700 /TAXON_ID=215587 /ORGANISM="Aplanochytrium stocchinoi, Strain GSBS06" /LENGTH=404 /DNA_ID=CAMNT_0052014871 /DNA_START=125 /DNA_END=1339 /DNA_ORIENTATION=+